MKSKALHTLQSLRSHLVVLILSGSGVPFALRLNARKLSILVLFVSSVFLTSITGSLLFFRELEINRRLEERVLELEMREQLAASPTIEVAPAVERDFVAPTIPLVLAPISTVKKEPLVISAAPPTVTVPGTRAVANAESTAAKIAPPTELPSATVKARLGDLSIDCAPESCTSKLTLFPTSTGNAQGHLLVILETEIPRIGAARSAASSVRTRYFVYPGNLSRDELTQSDISRLERKPFKFQRVLNTTVDFKISNLLRPIAVNVYLYDASKSLIHHERKVIDTVE